MPKQSIDELKRLLKEAEADRAQAKRDVGVEIKLHLEEYLVGYLQENYRELTYLTLADIFTASAKRYEVDGKPWNGMRPYPKGFTTRVDELKRDGMKDGAAKRKAKAEFEVVDEPEAQAPPPPARDARRVPQANRRH